LTRCWWKTKVLVEDGMVERQVKLNFGNRELKYCDEKGHKVILIESVDCGRGL
jgi:hypothetical protein